MTRLTSATVAAIRSGSVRHTVVVRVTPATAESYAAQFPDLRFAWAPRAEADADPSWKVRVYVGLAA